MELAVILIPICLISFVMILMLTQIQNTLTSLRNEVENVRTAAAWASHHASQIREKLEEEEK